MSSSAVLYDRSHHLVIGAGINGVLAAHTYSKAGVPVVIFDREGDVGGVWNKNLQCARVNTESRSQQDPAFFRKLGDYSPVEVNEGDFGGMWPTPEKVLEQTRSMVDDQKLKIFYKREVLNWSYASDSTTGEMDVTWKDLATGEVKTERFSGLHIRTGFQHNPRPIFFQNEKAFKGIRGFGMKDDIALSDLKGKEVVVIGAAPTAIDNAHRAVVAGAKRVTIVYRRAPRVFYTAYAFYLMSGLFTPDTLTNPDFLPSTYKKIVAALKKGWSATGNDFLNDCGFFIDIAGETHFRSTNGVDAFRTDSVLLAAKYGLVQFVKGEVDSLGEREVHLRDGKSLPCDVLVQSIGYKEELSLLKGHPTVGGFFVDGRANVTHFVGVDRVIGTKVYGPKTPEMMIYAPNVYNLEGFDSVAAYYLKHPEQFAQYITSPLFSSVVDVENFDVFEPSKLLPKVLHSGHDDAVKIIFGLLAERKAMRDQLLPPKKFLQLNKLEWDKLSALLAERTGKPLVPYPYLEELVAAESAN
jgi:hypothetical protein